MAKRISSKNVGQMFDLKFVGMMGNATHEETNELVEVIDEGTESARAVFRFAHSDSTWEAYRFNGRWAYGSSAEPLRVIK
jgi:hypothetical protein